MEKIKEKLKIILKKANMELIVVASYIPFIGWMIPLSLKKRYPEVILQAKQGFILAIFFICAILTLIFTNIFITQEFRVIRYIMVIIIYLLYALYLGICVWACIAASRNINKELPIVKKFIQQIKW